MSKVLAIVVPGICSLGLILGFGYLGFAQSPSLAPQQLKQQQEEVKQQQQQLLQKRDRLDNLETSASAYSQLLTNNLDRTVTQITNYENYLEQASQTLQILEKNLAQTKKAYLPLQKSMILRLRFLQRQSSPHQALDVLLKSEDLKTFIDNRYRLQQLYQADRQRLQKLREQAAVIEQQKLAIEVQKQQIALIQQQLLIQQYQVEAQLEIQKQLMNRLQSDRRALAAAEAQLNKDAETIAILIVKRLNQNKVNSPLGFGDGNGTTQLGYPHPGKITSLFGWRNHPILKTSRLHTGIDFGGSYGSTISAAGNGKVIFSGWYGGYGKTVIIDHGGGITTLYGHASELYVTEDMSVGRGVAIAAIGSTGLSTGPHLHFEVRKNGTPVNPMDYL